MIHTPASFLPHTLLCMLPAIVSTGCIYEDYACPPEMMTGVELLPDWQASPDADPEGMTCLFFPRQGGEPWKFDLTGRAGGIVSLPTGEYSFLTFNNDTDGIIFTDTGVYNDFALTTRVCSIFDGLTSDYREMRPVDIPGDPIAHITPDMIWTAADPQVTVTTGRSTLAYQPRQITCSYSYTVYNVAGLDNARYLSAAMSGLTGGIRLADLSPLPGQPVVLPFRAERSDSKSVTGKFHTFGAAQGARQYLLLFVWLTDGRKFCYQCDVTEQIASAPDPLNVSVRASNITLPEPESRPQPPGGGGLDVNVDDWHTITVDYKN